jgi:dCMP deaminase
MRPSRDQVYIDIAAVIARRSTCFRRSVGCVLVDVDGFILSTGYNGVAAGRPHCNLILDDNCKGYPNACEGAMSPSGQNLDACQAIHAEQNAIIRLPDPRRVHTAYCTASPCISCVKLLLGTYCLRIVFLQEYPHPTAKDWWLAAKREWIHIN